MLQLAIALFGARCIVLRLGIIGRFSEIPPEAILGIVVATWLAENCFWLSICIC